MIQQAPPEFILALSAVYIGSCLLSQHLDRLETSRLTDPCAIQKILFFSNIYWTFIFKCSITHTCIVVHVEMDCMRTMCADISGLWWQKMMSCGLAVNRSKTSTSESILWALASKHAYDALKCCLCWQLSKIWNRASMWYLIRSNFI